MWNLTLEFEPKWDIQVRSGSFWWISDSPRSSVRVSCRCQISIPVWALTFSDLSIGSIGSALGFESAGWFRRRFKPHLISFLIFADFVKFRFTILLQWGILVTMGRSLWSCLDHVPNRLIRMRNCYHRLYIFTPLSIFTPLLIFTPLSMFSLRCRCNYSLT